MLPELSRIQAEELELLKLSDSLTIDQAACCILGIPPSLVFRDEYNDRPAWHAETARRLPQLRFDQLYTVEGVIQAAISAGSLPNIPFDSPWETIYRIKTEDLKRWLEAKNTRPEFFSGLQASATPDYLNEHHPNFSPQLHAAVKAWEAIQDEELRKGKSVKAAATGWLESNYRALGLVHKGERNNSAIERIAALINWEPTGGAPKTPE